MMSEYAAGDGCMCYARSELECACSVDWTDPEVYKLRERIVELEKENKELQECFDECYEELRLTRDAVELEKELNVPINLNQFNYAFYKTNSGSVDGFYEWLKKWKHISAKVDENE